ncbi:MAG: hypothetical protein ABIE94_07035 [archaeon]
MNKNILIISICAIVIIVLLILHSIQIGMTVKITTPTSVSRDDLEDYGVSKRIILQTINIDNDYFLPRNYELPRTRVCIYDSTTLNGQELYSNYVSDGGFQSYPDNINGRIEVEAHGTKMVTLETNKDSYPHAVPIEEGGKSGLSEFDKILLVPVQDPGASGNGFTPYYDQYYVNCYSLTQEDVSKSVQIDLI